MSGKIHADYIPPQTDIERGLPPNKSFKVSDDGNLIITKTEAEMLKDAINSQFPTIANPAPVGLGGFALTTFTLSMYNAGVIVSLDSPHGVVMGLALFYGGLVQLLAGMWEIKAGNTIGAVAFASYGGFWMSFAALSIDAFGFLNKYSGKQKELDDCLGIYLLAWCIFSLLMTIGTHRTTVLLFTLLFTVFLTFLLLSIGHFVQQIALQRAGGIVGIIAAVLAWYGMMAGLLTKKNSLFTLPVGNMNSIYRKLGWLPADIKTA